MKQTGICPKCQSSDVARIKAFKATSTSNQIQLTKWGTQYAYFDRYVCISCGFMEHYVNLEEKSLQNWIEKERENKTLDSDFV